MRAEGEWKVCCKCRERKRLWDFSKSKDRADGLDNKCRYCFKSYRENNKVNKIANLSMDGDKLCRKCGLTKNISEFGHDAKNKSGRNSACKYCIANSTAEYKKRMLETNPELYRERRREYKHDWYYKNNGWLITKLTRQQKQQEKGL